MKVPLDKSSLFGLDSLPIKWAFCYQAAGTDWCKAGPSMQSLETVMLNTDTKARMMYLWHDSSGPLQVPSSHVPILSNRHLAEETVNCQKKSENMKNVFFRTFMQIKILKVFLWFLSFRVLVFCVILEWPIYLVICFHRFQPDKTVTLFLLYPF